VTTAMKRYLREGATLLRAAEADGWHPRECCICDRGKAQEALVGGDGYYLPRMCLHCGRRARA
jgi:hypothetical protein